MKKKIVIILGLVCILVGVLALPVFAALSIYGIEYNYDAAENEDALIVKWYEREWGIVKAGEFQLQGPPLKETTIAEVEARISEKFYDLLREDIKWNQLDPEEEPYLSDVLSPGEEIVYVGPQKYLRVWKGYFAIHIYSLDDLETPVSELRFVTCFVKRSIYPGGTSQEEIFPDGWWPA